MTSKNAPFFLTAILAATEVDRARERARSGRQEEWDQRPLSKEILCKNGECISP